MIKHVLLGVVITISISIVSIPIYKAYRGEPNFDSKFKPFEENDLYSPDLDNPPRVKTIKPGTNNEAPIMVGASRYYPATVVRVIDGDTIIVKFNVWADITLEKSIRFLEVDTWEVRGANKEKGLAAKMFLENTLKEGQVYLFSDGSTGKYGRTLGKMFVIIDGRMVDVNKLLIDNGHQKLE